MWNLNAWKKVILIFVARRSPYPQNGHVLPQIGFCSFLQKYCFFQKNCFVIIIRDEKGYINFLSKKPSFSEKWSNVPPKLFFAVSSENTVFSEKII